MHSTYLGWLHHLPELGDPLRAERDRLLAKLNEAHFLERRAMQLASEVRAGEKALLSSLTKHWSRPAIQAATRRAGVDRRALGLATVRDFQVRTVLEALDDHLTAAEAVRVFGAADVLRQQTVRGSTSETDRLAMLDRVIAWWTFAGKPVYGRLEAHPAKLGDTASNA